VASKNNGKNGRRKTRGAWQAGGEKQTALLAALAAGIAGSR